MDIMLVHDDGAASPTRFVLHRRFHKVGSDATCDFQLSHPKVPPVAFTLEKGDKGVVLRGAMASGLKVNGRAVAERQTITLNLRDRIDIAGAVELTVDAALAGHDDLTLGDVLPPPLVNLAKKGDGLLATGLTGSGGRDGGSAREDDQTQTATPEEARRIRLLVGLLVAVAFLFLALLFSTEETVDPMRKLPPLDKLLKALANRPEESFRRVGGYLREGEMYYLREQYPAALLYYRKAYNLLRQEKDFSAPASVFLPTASTTLPTGGGGEANSAEEAARKRLNLLTKTEQYLISRINRLNSPE